MIDQRIVELTHKFCTTHLAHHGYQRLFLIGSRARGDAKETSDYDFVAVVEDAAPQHVLAGQNMSLINEFCSYTSRLGIGKIDLLISTKSRVEMVNPTPDDLVPYSCQQHGKQMWEKKTAP